MAMKNGATLAESWLNAASYDGHIPLEDGDFIGPEGRVHCGKCKEGKEFYLERLGRFVPSLCACGRAARAAEDERLRRLALAEVCAELRRASLLDGKLAGATFDAAQINEANADAYATGRGYVKNFLQIAEDARNDMRGLLLYGPPGTGKSWLAACIANALMAQNVPTLFLSVPRLLSGSVETIAETLEILGRAKLLVLDDLGAERATEYRTEQVFNVVEARLNIGKPLIVTTNNLPSDLDGLEARFKRIWERVRVMCYPVRMAAGNWRKTLVGDAKERFLEICGLGG